MCQSAENAARRLQNYAARRPNRLSLRGNNPHKHRHASCLTGAGREKVKAFEPSPHLAYDRSKRFVHLQVRTDKEKASLHRHSL